MGGTARQEFAAYLRSRRARLQPSDVGLPLGTRRRVTGLRREEVAQLAGVGLTWYTWLEQGRPIAASVQVLGSIAGALRLTDDERDHLFALAGTTPPERAASECVHPPHRILLDRLMPYPAAVQTARFEMLAYNHSYRMLFGDLDLIPRDRRNCARLLLTDPVWKSAHLDLELDQRRMVARLRANYGRHRDEPAWQQFIAELREQSPEFASLWQDGEVATQPHHIKRLRHPEVGELQLEMTSMWLDETLGARMVWFGPADESTERALETLAELAPRAVAA